MRERIIAPPERRPEPSRTLPAPPRQAAARASLPAPLRARLEAATGERLDGVAIHADTSAATAASAAHAQAITQGDDIHFAAGRFQPSTPAGDALIAHEVAHVVQQRPGPGPARGVATGALECEADGFAASFAAGLPAPLSRGAAPSAPQLKKDNEWTAVNADSKTLMRQNGKVFSTASTLPDVGVSTDGDNALLAVNHDGKTLMPLAEAAEIGEILGEKILRVRPAKLTEDEDYPTHYHFSFTGRAVGMLADGTQVLNGENGPPVAPDKLPASLAARLDADSVVRAYGAAHPSWSYMVVSGKGQWMATTHTVGDIRSAEGLIVAEYDKLPASDAKTRVEEYLPLIVAVATHEGKFDSTSGSDSDPMASLGLFQWGSPKATNVGADRTATLYEFFATLHAFAVSARLTSQAVALATAGAMGATPEQKLYMDAWKQCTDQGLDLRADGMLTLNGGVVTGKRLEEVMHRPMGRGALRTYQLVGALGWIDYFKKRLIHPGTWPTTRARLGNGFDETDRIKGGKAHFAKRGFRLDLEARNPETVGGAMTSVKHLAKIVTVGVNRPFYVEAALWLAMVAGRDPKAEAAPLLATLEAELKAASPLKSSFTKTDVDQLSAEARAAFAQLEELVWPHSTVSEVELLGRFQSAALDLWRADGSNLAKRGGRLATVDALF